MNYDLFNLDYILALREEVFKYNKDCCFLTFEIAP